MNKINEDQRAYVSAAWKNRWDWILHTQNQILNWIFAVHAGGIAGMLTFAASAGGSTWIITGLTAFSIGLVLTVLYGVVMYYEEQRDFRSFKADSNALFSKEINWDEFCRRDNLRPEKHGLCEIIAWASGLVGLLGIISAAYSIL